MNNARILHGRTGFDPNSGMRHLEVAYMPWDYFTGKQNFKKIQTFISLEVNQEWVKEGRF